MAQHAPRPKAIELFKAETDAGAAGPVYNSARSGFQGNIHILVAQVAADIGEPRTEHKTVHTIAMIADGVHEMKKHAGVLGHRAGDVAENNDSWRPYAIAFELQRNGRAISQ